MQNKLKFEDIEQYLEKITAGGMRSVSELLPEMFALDKRLEERDPEIVEKIRCELREYVKTKKFEEENHRGYEESLDVRAIGMEHPVCVFSQEIEIDIEALKKEWEKTNDVKKAKKMLRAIEVKYKKLKTIFDPVWDYYMEMRDRYKCSGNCKTYYKYTIVQSYEDIGRELYKFKETIRRKV